MRFLGPFWVGTNFSPYHVPDIEEQSADFLAIWVKLLAEYVYKWGLTDIFHRVIPARKTTMKSDLCFTLTSATSETVS